MTDRTQLIANLLEEGVDPDTLDFPENFPFIEYSNISPLLLWEFKFTLYYKGYTETIIETTLESAKTKLKRRYRKVWKDLKIKSVIKL